LEEAQKNVDIAVDRMQDAEDYARLIDAQNEVFRQEAQRLKKSSVVGYAVGGISFGVGVPLIAEGIRQDNSAMLWTGVGAIGVGAIVWSVGHYVFEWW